MLKLIIALVLIFCSSLAAQDLPLPENYEARYRLVQSGVETGQADIELKKKNDGCDLIATLVFSDNDTEVKISSTSSFNEGKSLVRYIVRKSYPGRSETMEIAYSGNQATLVSGGERRSVTIPGKRIPMDNYCVSDLILFAKSLSPEMKKTTGKLFVASRMMLADYEVVAAGPGRYIMDSEVIQCDLYQIRIAGSVEAEFYIQDGTLIAFLQKPDHTAFELIR